MNGVLILHTSTIPEYEGKVRLIEPSLHAGPEETPYQASKTLAQLASHHGANVLLGVGFYTVEVPDRGRMIVGHFAYGTAVSAETDIPPWMD